MFPIQQDPVAFLAESEVKFWSSLIVGDGVPYGPNSQTSIDVSMHRLYAHL